MIHLVLSLLLLMCTACQAQQHRLDAGFVDMAGRHVAIKLPAKRVVTAGAIPAIDSSLALLGKKDAIQNGLPRQLHSARWAFLRKIISGLSERPAVSSMGPDWTPDYEALSAVSYDVVVLDSLSTATSMEKRGLPAVVVHWSGPDSVKGVIQSLGKLMGETERARSYVEYYDALLASLGARLRTVAEKPSVLYIRLSNFTLPIIGNSCEIVARAGGSYVVDPARLPDHAPFSHEQLLEWNPEFLFVWSPAEVEEVMRDARWATLRAVRNKRVLAVPMGTHLWMHYSPETPLGVLWVAHVLHPELVSREELEHELTAFYARFYAYPLQPKETQAILSGLP